MTHRPPRTWRRIVAHLPQITFALAVAVTVATALWAIWALGWLW